MKGARRDPGDRDAAEHRICQETPETLANRLS